MEADTRIDITVDHARKYAEQLIDLDPDAFAVVVTHMDLVTWDQRRFSDAINRKLGMDAVVYTQPNTTSSVLQQDILKVCSKSFDLSVDEENFFKLFKIANNNLKILKTTKKEVELFKQIKESFAEQRKNHKENEKDLLFEFQAFMTEEITNSQKRVASENNFTFGCSEDGDLTFDGESAANEAGHIANLSNLNCVPRTEVLMLMRALL